MTEPALNLQITADALSEAQDVAADFLNLVTKHLSVGADLGVIAGGIAQGLTLLSLEAPLDAKVIGSVLQVCIERNDLRLRVAGS